MAGLLDMLFGAQGWFPNSPLATTLGAQKAQDPYALAAQLGGMQTTDPQYAAIQAQMNDALAKQKSQAANLGLIAGGLGMMGARDQYGRPAGIVGGLSQGFEKGVAEDRDYLKNARELSGGLLGAQAQGQKIASGRQNLQQGAYSLETAKYLKDVLGVPDKDVAVLIQGMQGRAAAAEAMKQLANDPSKPADVRQRAALLADTIGKDPNYKFNPIEAGNYLYGKALDPTTKALRESQTGVNKARLPEIAAHTAELGAKAGLENKFAGVEPSTGLPKISPVDDARYHAASREKVKIFLKSLGELKGMTGSGINTAELDDMFYREMRGIPSVPGDTIPFLPPDTPPNTPVKVPMPDGSVEYWGFVNGLEVPMSGPSAKPKTDTSTVP